MKQWNLGFEGEAALRDFVAAHDLEADKGVLVQILTGCDDHQAVEAIHETVRRVLPQATIIGMASALQMLGGGFREEGTVLVVTRFEKSRLSQWQSRFDASECVARLAEDMARQMPPETKVVLLFSNAVDADVEGFVARYRELVEVPVVGGLATSYDASDPSPLVISTPKICYDDALVAVFVAGEDLLVHTVTLQAWETIGREFTVTRAEGKRLYTLDGTSIKEVYAKYFGPLTPERLLYLSLAHPLVRRTEEMGSVTRVMLEYHGDYGVYTGKFLEGERVQIGFGNYKKMIDCIHESRQTVRSTPAEAFWGFVCLSFMRGYQDLLVRSMRPYLQNIDAIALAITFGEFGQVDGKNAFLNNTIVKVYLSEDPGARFRIDDIEVPLDEKDQLLSTFSTLVTSSSREIIQFNRELEQKVQERTRALAQLTESLERRIEREVQKNREKDKMLYHQSKLASMGEMINNIAHQWRQPLNIIALVMQDIVWKQKMGHLEAEDLKRAENKINETLKYLSDTIDDFRSFAAEREDRGQPGNFEVARAVREAVRLVSILLEDVKIRLELDLPELECVVPGRANDLKQVILNLVYNAIDVLKERGIADPVIRIAMRQNSHAVVSVEDNGGGIEEGLKEKIFEPYFTTKYRARGTGLGLYMSRMIVEKRLGGQIRVSNTPEGAKFEIYLPVLAC